LRDCVIENHTLNFKVVFVNWKWLLLTHRPSAKESLCWLLLLLLAAEAGHTSKTLVLECLGLLLLLTKERHYL
jgi:hypothetical protein